MWCGELSSECGVSCLLNGASCPLNVGRVVLVRVFFGASCLGGELSVILMNPGHVGLGSNRPESSRPGQVGLIYKL